MRHVLVGLALVAMAGGCASTQQGGGTFADDLALLKKHTDVVVLSDKAGGPGASALVAVVPSMQGRVMTSSAEGPGGLSFGWINRSLVDSGKTLEHFNPFGGEDRFWLGPEGGQFSIYFAKGVPFDLDHWYVPADFDTRPFAVVAKTGRSIHCRRQMTVTNYSGTRFDVLVDREVRLLAPAAAWKALGVPAAAGVRMVAYESVNRITNTGKEAWKKETGLLSVWILGMFTPSPTMTIVVPIHGGPESERGLPVKDDYFGKVPADRLIVKNNVVFFSADGKCRSKIGFNPRRAKGVEGSYDATNRVLTLVQYTLPAGVTDYVNSMWALQKDPYGGDAANCYNDGPPAPGKKPMGPFCELESSSPAAALEPGKSLEHVHRTVHLVGDEKALDPIARAALGVGIEEIKAVFAK